MMLTSQKTESQDRLIAVLWISHCSTLYG